MNSHRLFRVSYCFRKYLKSTTDSNITLATQKNTNGNTTYHTKMKIKTRKYRYSFTFINLESPTCLKLILEPIINVFIHVQKHLKIPLYPPYSDKYHYFHSFMSLDSQNIHLKKILLIQFIHKLNKTQCLENTLKTSLIQEIHRKYIKHIVRKPHCLEKNLKSLKKYHSFISLEMP